MTTIVNCLDHAPRRGLGQSNFGVYIAAILGGNTDAKR